MFYSHQLLSKKGALGTIWVAAHSLNKLKKEDVSNTNISSSVDKILLDEVPVVTYRILAYLLLGIVRIYSKKVEYLFRDCNDVLSEVRHFITSKKCDADIEVMCAPYFSITVPERFELDAFDLEIIETLNRDHIKTQEEITLEEKKDGICSPSFYQSYMEEDTSHLGGFSAVHDTCNNSYSMSASTPEMLASTLPNLRNLDRSMEEFCNNRFSLEDCLPPMLFDEAEERADPGRTFLEDKQTEGVEMNPPNSPIMSVDGERPGGNAESLVKEHADSAKTEFSKLMGLQNEKVQIISPKRPVSLYISVDATPEPKVANSPGARTPGLIAVDTPATKEGARVSKKRKCVYDANEIVITDEVGGAGLDDPCEGTHVLKKRKGLYDANKIVISNEVYKAGLDDPSDLVKKRKKIALGNNAKEMSENIFFMPLIPGVSIDFSILREKEQKSPVNIETTKTPTKSHDIGPLGSHETCEENSVAPSSYVTNSVSQHYNNTCGSTNSERLGCARSFASVDRELSTIGDPKFDVSSRSFASVDGELSPIENLDFDESLMTNEEEINLCGGDDEERSRGKKRDKLDTPHSYIERQTAALPLLPHVKKSQRDHRSTRTRSVARFLHLKFLARKERGENEVVKLSQVVEGKSKKRNARLFHELLALTTQGFLDVKQDKPYDDIIIVETSKLKQSFEADNMA